MGGDDFKGFFGFSLLEVLSYTVDETEVRGASELHLLINYFLVFREVSSAVVVAHEHPLNAVISELLSADFARKSAAGVAADILSTYLDVVGDSCLGEVEVEETGEDEQFQLVLVVAEVVNKISNNVSDKVSGAVALPVGHHAVLPLGVHALFYFFT